MKTTIPLALTLWSLAITTTARPGMPAGNRTTAADFPAPGLGPTACAVDARVGSVSSMPIRTRSCVVATLKGPSPGECL